MRERSRQPGFTLIEVMVSMVILLVGALGLMGLASVGNRLNGDSRRMTRATAIAQDLVAQIAMWPYDDPRLSNSNAANDLDIADDAQRFEGPFADLGAFAPDHAEADLALGAVAFTGVPQAVLQSGGYERYWNVSQPDDWNGNGTPDTRRMTVIVRWPQGAGFRRIVLFTVKINPADTQQ